MLAEGDQFLMWSEDGKTFASFGPNQEIRIHTGQIRFLKGCGQGGADDFVEPYADIYVVPSGKGAPGEKLTDVSGSPNTVQGVHGGLFISEVIGYTAPGGKIGPGKYTVVYDECQDGTVSPEDKVFPDAFEVVFPEDIPNIMADPAIAKAKQKAADAEAEWQDLHDTYRDFFALQSKLGTLGKVWQCGGLKETAISVSTSFSLTLVCPKIGGKPLPGVVTSWDVQNGALIDGFFTGLTKGVEWATGVNPKQLVLKQILATASHYKGIAADPPNPDFQKLTPLETRDVITTESNDPETIAAVGIGNELGNEGPLLQAFLTSIEKYQGSVIAKDGDWALIHARAVKQYAAQLKEQIRRTNTSIAIAKQVVEADPRPLDQTVADLQAFRNEAASQGLSPELVRNLKNLGYTDVQIDDMKKEFLAQSGSFSKAAMLNQLDALRSTNDALIAAFGELAVNMEEDWISYLTAMQNVHDKAPIVNAGGPYAGQEGSVISFDGSASASPSGIVSYEWDLDGDGAFDDATGPKPTYKYDLNANKLAGLKVTNADGWSNIGYATVFIENSDKGPMITNMVPDRAETEVITGETKNFAIEAEDPEGDAVQVDWYVDRVHVGSGSAYAYTPSDDKVGKHIVEVIVTDSAKESYEAVSWPVSVLMPDDDGDGWRNNVDCRPQDPGVNPGAVEKRGNGKDDDCNPNTSDEDFAPNVFFNAGGLGKVVSFDLQGAKIEAASSSYDGRHVPEQLLALGNESGLPWATSRKDNQWVKISLAGSGTYLIDRVQVQPRPMYDNQRVKDFEVAVSSTTLDDAAFKTVLKATAANNGNVQEFKLPKPVLAKYVMYRPLNAQGGGEVISTQQFRVKTPQISVPTVTFENLSTDPEDDIVSWEWNFGDNSPVSTEKNPTHMFPDSGTYPVKLKATDAAGNTDTYTMQQTIQAVDFEYAPKNPKEGETVTFYNTSIGADNGQLKSRTWNFGDGSSAAVQNDQPLTHSFKDNEAYTVMLETVDQNGKKYQGKKTIIPTNVAPTVNAGLDKVARSGQKVDFLPSITDPGADGKTCRWIFGDGTTSDVCNASHTYPALSMDAPDKKYTAVLIVTDDDGGTGTDSRDIIIRADREQKIVAYYTFDGDFKDYSGYNNNGTPTGTMSFADGLRGKAAKFDGKSGINVKDADSLDFSTSLTLSIWLYKEDAGAGGWAPVLSKGETSNYEGFALLHDSYGISPAVRFTDGFDETDHNLASSALTKMKEWYLLTVTWDGTTIKYYVNDKLMETKQWTGVFRNSTSQLLIGYDPPGKTEYFRGMMDNFRLYNYPLSQQEISDLYQNDQQPADQEPPVTTAQVTPSAPNGNNGWYTTDTSITLTAADLDSGVEKTEYRLNQGTWQVYNGPIAITDNGSYNIEYRSTDKAGNVEAIKSVSLKLDKTKPVTTAEVTPLSPNNWRKTDASVILSATDQGSGIDKIQYRMDEGDWQVYETPIAVNTDGIHTVEYRSIDRAGNVEESESVIVRLDKTKPVTAASVTPGPPDGENGWYTKDVTVELSAADEQSGLNKTEYRIDGSEWLPYGTPLHLSSEGVHTIEYRSTDNAGNTEDAKTLQIKIDKTAPELTLKLNQGSLWPPNHKMVTIKVTPEWKDALSGIQSIVLTSIMSNELPDGSGDGHTAQDIQNAAYGTADFEFDLRAERSGGGTGRIYTITYTITDKAGNARKVSTAVAVAHDQSKH
ncbi:PKD domain-containing protein [Neobacillus vireti]|uniref:OmpL47-type beta-barrel domain-containing protein n=1 Tax=Neobacillus vireti TaxID=220686 RepID=UPI002FFD9155